MTAKMDEVLLFMINKYPTCQKEILYAYTNDEDFKSLCEDYFSATTTYGVIQRKLIKDYKGELEYRELFLMLEHEIINFLEKEQYGTRGI